VGTSPLTRPAFYALESGGWRDYVTLLHLPYTAWHLSYVVIGAALTPEFAGRRLLAALAAFFLALGIGAHALDELNGRPLHSRIPSGVLIGLAAVSVAAATAIGVAAALAWTPWLLVFVVAGAFLVVAYNLELFGGAFHGDLWFGLAWGAFPLLTTYFVVAERLTDVAILGALFACVTSLAQRMLSTQVRDIRRRGVGDVAMLAAPEAALRLLSVAMPVLAATLLAVRF
jgi:4-hydroxybenzoate polyprenyltransferase